MMGTGSSVTEALQCMSRAFELVRFHLQQPNIDERTREGLIVLAGSLGNVPHWIAEGKIEAYSDYLGQCLAMAKGALELVEADDFPALPDDYLVDNEAPAWPEPPEVQA